MLNEHVKCTGNVHAIGSCKTNGTYYQYNKYNNYDHNFN